MLKPAQKMSESEMEVMRAIWAFEGPVTSAQVQESLSGQAHVTLLHHGVKVHESFWSQGGMELQWEKEEDQNAENRKRGLS